MVGDVPLYALDKHTRSGREAIFQVSRENADVHDCLAEYVAPRDRREAAYLAAFYTAASPLSRQLIWSQAATLERFGIETDLLVAGVPLEDRILGSTISRSRPPSDVAREP